MSNLAGLLLTAADLSESVTTHAARHYYKGMRDAFAATLAACHGLDAQTDVETYARGLIASMDDDASRRVLSDSNEVLTSYRRAAVGETATVTEITTKSAG